MVEKVRRAVRRACHDHNAITMGVNASIIKGLNICNEDHLESRARDNTRSMLRFV